ncbi:MAG: hypothetical protein ACREBE_24110, partial [bacterium]
MRGRLVKMAPIGVLIAVLGGIYLIFLAGPAIPANAAQAPIARTEMTGPIAPDMGTEDGAEVPPISPHGGTCLARLERSAGWADVCWEAYRVPQDSDPQKDYYQLRVYGTYQATTALGIRWFTVRSRLVDPPLGDVYDGWPTGTYDGPCEQQAVNLMMLTSPDLGPVTVCGHTTSGPGEGWTWASTWTCGPCWPFDP